MATKSKVSFDLVLAIDCETSGIAMGFEDPVYHPDGITKYQAISFGLIVADVNTLLPIDELYVEIQFDPEYTWNDQAEAVHGLSREHLAANGLSRAEAATKIREFLEKYYGPIELIRKLPMLGHNVGTFDRLFFADLMTGTDNHIQIGNRHIDTFTLGVTLLDLFSSNEIFDFFQLKRDPEKHNALQDARFALKAARMMRKFFKDACGGQ